MLRRAGRIPGRREEWDRELFEKTEPWGLRHGFASIGDLPALALEHAASDTGVDFRFDPLFDNLPELLTQICGLVHAREFKRFESGLGTGDQVFERRAGVAHTKPPFCFDPRLKQGGESGQESSTTGKVLTSTQRQALMRKGGRSE